MALVFVSKTSMNVWKTLAAREKNVRTSSGPISVYQRSEDLNQSSRVKRLNWTLKNRALQVTCGINNFKFALVIYHYKNYIKLN